MMTRTNRTEPSPKRGLPLVRRLRTLYLGLQRDSLPRLILFVALLVVVGGLLVYLTETRLHSGVFSRMFDSIWWAFVTITTVGYGDKVPATVPGRILAILIMLLGIVAISTLSGTIASILVDRKIREGKGLQEVNLRSHAVICGWNATAERILEGLGHLYRGGQRGVVLVNEMDAEAFQGLSARHPDMDLRFVRGDFSNEKVLRRASIQTAKTAIILADTAARSGAAIGPDERTILTALAVKALNSEVNTVAEVIDGENEQHLRRANVDEILVNGEFNGFLLSSAAVAPAIPLVTKELLSFESPNFLKQVAVPMGYVGKTFGELSEHFMSSGAGVLIGLLSEENKMSLDDILSEGSSAIDAFIKQKFAEAELDVFEGEREELRIRLNPGRDYVIRDNEAAFVIGGAAG